MLQVGILKANYLILFLIWPPTYWLGDLEEVV